MHLNNGRRAWVLLLAAGCLLGLLILPSIAYAQDDDWEAGDAPSSYNSYDDPSSPTGSALMTAYPKGGPLGVRANFPVVVFPTTAQVCPDGYGMCHEEGPSYLGPPPALSKSYEYDADQGFDEDFINNIIPLADTPDQDGHDDGVTFPAVLSDCSPVNIQVEGSIGTVGAAAEGWIEVWADWNRDGDWNDGVVCGCGDDEWAVQDFAVLADPVSRRFSASIPIVPCHPGSMTAPLWVRVTLSDREFLPEVGSAPELAAGGVPYWEACLFDGETEDYYVVSGVEFVPEWGSVALLGSGLAGLAGYATLRWRRK